MHLATLLLDIDGTLVDSNDAHARCWIEAFAHFGKQLEYDVVRHQIGKGGDLLVPDLLNAKEMRRFGEELKKFRSELYKNDYLPHVQPFPRTKETMAALHERGITLVLASSSNEDEVEYYTRLLGVEELIAGSTSKGDAELSKPSPEIFRAALERSGRDAERAFAVGDTPYDVLAAHRIPIPIIAVLSGGFEIELLAKAELILRDFAAVPDHLDEINRWFEE